MDERPMFGYKLVGISGGRFGVAKLHVPRDAFVVETDYKMSFRGMPAGYEASPLVRTNKVKVMSITPVGGKEADMVTSGASIRTHCPLAYNVGKFTETDLDTTNGRGNGIHFFWKESAAGFWNAMFK